MMHEGLFVVTVIALICPALILVALAKLGALSREVEELKRMIRGKVTLDADRTTEARDPSPLQAKSDTMAERGDCGAQGLTVLPNPVETQPKPVAAPAAPKTQPPVVEQPKPIDEAKWYNPPHYEPTAADRFWEKLEDWFFVRGDFAPKGMTREFAVATRWLLRIGSLLLVGAMAYFITLAINKGWIGPTQRVYGMMFWGVVGTVGGTWLKVKSERYSILGEVFAALGLVATYLSFGLGHRYFNPPVIGSVGVAFAGLVVATVAAGVLSVRLKSLTIAVLGLVGGFLVPTICSFSHNYDELIAYLTVLTVGAAAVAYLRQWTALGFVAIAVAFGFAAGVQMYVDWTTFVGVTYNSFEYALVLALTLAGLKRRSVSANGYCWMFVTVAAIASTVGSLSCLTGQWSMLDKWFLLLVAAVHAALAWQSRKRAWGGTPALIVLAFLAATGALCDCCEEWRLWEHFGMLVFCAFAAVLAELSVRTKERTLAVLSLVVTAICIFSWFVVVGNRYDRFYAYWAGFSGRALDVLPLPSLCAFVGWRLGAKGMWLESLRKPAFVIAAVLGFIFVTLESHWFGKLVLPSVGGGCITIVWAAIAAALLTAGIVRRWKTIRLTGLWLLGLPVFKVLFIDTASLATTARVAAFAAVGVLMVAGAFLYLKFRNRFEEGQK